jgi:hypothetical protein
MKSKSLKWIVAGVFLLYLLMPVVSSLTVTSITPPTGDNTGIVSITNLAGSSFDTASTVVLTPVNVNPVHKGSIGYALLNPNNVYVAGDYAYLASGTENALVIVDVSNKATPVLKGKIMNGDGGALLSLPSGIAVNGNYAYVASFSSNALEIVDVSNPAAPAHKASIGDGDGGAELDQPNDVFVDYSGHYAYVTSYLSNSLEIVDISDPAAPVHTGSIVDGAGGASLNHPNSVYVRANYAYVTSYDDNTLEIIDVSNKAAPVHKGSIANGAGGALLNGPYSIYAAENYAYVVSRSSNALEIVDVTDPAAPVHKGSIVNGAGGARLNNPYSISFGHTLTTPTFETGNYAYVASDGSDALEIVDVTDPAAPVHKGSIVNGAGGALLSGPIGVYVSGDYAFVTSFASHSLEIVDIGTVTGYNVHLQTSTPPYYLTCDFDLTGKIADPYNVVVTNPLGPFGTLASGFTVTAPPSTPPVAAFTATSPTFGEAPLTVSFSDLSTSSSVPSWAWCFGDESSTGIWTLSPTPPWSARGGHSTVVLPDGSIVLMGGILNSNSMNDVWRSTDNGITWTQQKPNDANGWSGRNHHTSVALSDGSIILMGGGAGSPITRLKDVWKSEDKGATWTLVNANAPWGERQELTSVVMPTDVIVVIGGVESGVNPPNGWTNDVWLSTDKGATWTQQTANAGWTPRYGQSSLAMPDGSIVMMGGFDGSFKNDVWQSTDYGATWTQQKPNDANGWSGRNRHSTVVMQDGSIVLMGGYDTPSDDYQNDVWRSTNNGATWTLVNNNAWLTGLQSSEAAAMPDGSIIFTGGYGPGITFTNDVWRLIGSSAQNPSHTYTTPGIYQVALQVCNAVGCDSIQKKAYVSVPEPSVFSQQVINGVNVVLKNKLNYDTTGVSVNANPQVQNAPNVPLLWGQQPLSFETSSCSLVAIDHGPNANGERKIDYMCVDQIGNIVDPKVATAPPSTNYAFTQAAGEALDVGENWTPYDPDAWEPTCAENCNNYYALLIDGGTDANNNYRRYWNDIAFMYITLREYGYSADHITVLMSDGNAGAGVADRCIAVSGTTCTQTQDSPQNLDGIGGNEVITAATRANVLAQLRTLKTGLTSSQNLFIFTTGHGGGDNTGNSNLKLWNNAQITDADFFNALYGTGVADSVTQTANSADPNGIPSITLVMEQCQGYGFKGDFTPSGATGNRVITTAANYNEPSYGNLFSNAWTVGVAGHTRYFPTTLDLSADSSGDKRVTTAEAYTYAVAHDSVATAGTEHPQKYALGSERFMNDCTGTATKSITVTLPTATGIRWAQSSPHEIQWTEDGLTGTVNIYLVKGGVEQSPAIATGVSANQGIYRWTVPDNALGTDYKIRVRTSDSVTIGNSVNNFEIYAKSGTDANNKGTLVFSTNPTGASIFLDGSTTSSGTTTPPLTVSGLMQGDHRVVVKLSGYYDQSYLVTVTAQNTNTLPTWILDKIETNAQNGEPLDWSPYGGMKITSDPDGAKIWIDYLADNNPAVYKGDAIGEAKLDLPPGSYSVYATKDNYQSSEIQPVTVVSYSLLREPVRVHLVLNPSPNVAPVVNAGADATITRGSTFSQSGSFTDPDTNPWTATVNYGDGSGNLPLSLTDKTFTLNHKYMNVGPYTVTVTVDDHAGGVGTDTAIVKVGYTFAGFYQPIDMGTVVNNVGSIVNSAKAGQAVPTKWHLSDWDGIVSDPTSFGALKSYTIGCSDLAGKSEDAIEEYSAGGSDLQYKGNGDWQYNWKTLKGYSGTCRKMYVEFNSGQKSPEVPFKFK